MGNEHLRNRLESSLGSQQQQQSQPTPGKQTQVQQGSVQQGSNRPAGLSEPTAKPSPYRTGNAFVDQGLACDDEGRSAAALCFLSPAQRSRLLLGFQERVLAAQGQYVGALAELRVDELLKKDPEKSDIFMELLIEVIAVVAVPAIGRAINLLRSGAAHVLEHSIQDADALTAALRSSAGEKKIEAVIKSAVGMGKKRLTNAATKGEDPEAHEKKTANLAFLSILTEQSALIYQNLRENAVAEADDAALAVLFQAFDAAMGHTVGAYKAALKDKLDRFEKSQVGDIGVTDNPEIDPLHPNRDGSFLRQWDTRAYWVKTRPGRRLGLYRRDYQKVPTTVGIGDDERAASPSEYIKATVKDSKREFTFMRYVPIEFEDVAVAMHQTQWGGEPLEREPRTPEEFSMARVTI